MCVCVCQSFSCFQLFATPWTVAGQAPLSMEFSRQECWSGLPCPSPGDLHFHPCYEYIRIYEYTHMHRSLSEIIHISCAKFKSFTGGIMENLFNRLVWKFFLCMANVSLSQSLSCARLCDPMDCSPSCSSVQGILQARVLKWVAVSFSKMFHYTTVQTIKMIWIRKNIQDSF